MVWKSTGGSEIVENSHKNYVIVEKDGCRIDHVIMKISGRIRPAVPGSELLKSDKFESK